MIGKRLSHYQVLREIGEGGMGVVYLARDEHLHCDVALELISADACRFKTKLRQLLPDLRHRRDLQNRGTEPLGDRLCCLRWHEKACPHRR